MNCSVQPWWTWKSAVTALLVLFVVMVSAHSAQAALRAPLQGAAFKNGLTPDQHRRAMYFKALKTSMLQSSGSDATEAIQRIETVHNIVQTINNVVSMTSTPSEMSEVTADKLLTLGQYSGVIKGSISPKIVSYITRKGVGEASELVLVLTAHFLTVLSTELPALVQDSVFQSYLNALEAKDANGIGASLNGLLNHQNLAVRWIANATFSVTLDLVASIPDLHGIGLESKRLYVLLQSGNGFWKSLQLAGVAQKSISPSTLISNAVSICNDLVAASFVADVTAQMKTNMIALEFLDYYLVTYGGDLSPFKGDMTAESCTSVDCLFEAFLKQDSGVHQTMEQFYGPVDWQDYLFFNRVDKTAASDLIRKIMRETGGLAFQITYQGAPETSYVAVGDTIGYSFVADPLLLMDYTFSAAAVTERHPNGIKNHSFTSPGIVAPVTLVPGNHGFDVDYGVTRKGSQTLQTFHFSFSDDIYVPASSLTPAQLTITPTVVKDIDYELSLSLSAPENMFAYQRPAGATNGSASGILAKSSGTILVRVTALNGFEDTVSDWEDISSGSATVTMPLHNTDALTARYGDLGSYRIEMQMNHPYLFGRKTAPPYTTTINYNDIVAKPTVPYLEIQAPASVRALSLGADYLRFVTGDVLKLYPRNVAGWPDFSALAGSVKVAVLDQDYTDYLLSGTRLADGSVQITIPAWLPDRYYKILAVFSLDGEIKHNPGPFSNYQLLGLNWYETSSPPPATTARMAQWGDRVTGFGAATVINDIKAIAAGVNHDLVLKTDGTVVVLGGETPPSDLSGVVAISAGSYFSLALKNDGTVVTWGSGYKVPDGLNGVSAIAAGESFSAAVKNDGTVVAWGYNGNGQTTVPAGLTGVVKISAGFQHLLALKSDRTVVAWGDNFSGQASVPPGLSGVTAIAAGSDHSLALKSDGTVVAWGSNLRGQTGVPAFLSGVIAIAAGDHHSLALKSDGTVVAWGSVNYDQARVPFGLKGVTAIAAGGNHNLVLANSIPESIVFPTPVVTFLSENLPDGSYQVGPATKIWRFKTGADHVTSLRAVYVSRDSHLGAYGDDSFLVGDIAANTEFMVALPIDPRHDGSGLKTAYLRLVDAHDGPVLITNSTNNQFWVKVKTNRPPVVSQLQLNSVAGKEGQQVCLPVLVADPDGDALMYSVTVGGGTVSSYTTPAYTEAWRYCNTFAAGLHAITVTADDQHGSTVSTAFQAVVTSDSHLKDFYNDVRYADATTQALKDQYNAIHYLTLNGITIGLPVDPNDPGNLARNFQPTSIANQAEALGMIMKAASLRGMLDLDAEPRWLPNLVKEDVANGVYYNFSWALPYVLKAEEMGMIPDAEGFEPKKPVAREWLAVMVARMMALEPPEDAIDPALFVFADEDDFSASDNYDAARATAFFGYMVGRLGSAVIFNPKDAMIRADVAVVTAKILRTPSIDGITTSGLAMFPSDLGLLSNDRYDVPSLIHGQSFTVTGGQNLFARRMLGDGAGKVQEDPVFTAADYTTATIIRPGSGIVAIRLFKDLAKSPVTVPTNPPDVSSSEVRSLIVMLESVDDDGRNGVRSIYRAEYGVIFPDTDGDGVRNESDTWPYLRKYSVDANGNGIPDNADSLLGLTGLNGSDSITINGRSLWLITAVLEDVLVNDTTAPSTITPTGGTFTNPQIVMLSADETATIRCTTDGSTPTDASAVCGTITVDKTTTLKFFATDFMGNREAIQEVEYVITPIEGRCGFNSNGTFLVAPTTGLCWIGTVSEFTGTGPWSWACSGLYGGAAVSCSANVPAYTVTYEVGIGGRVSGSSEQSVSRLSTGSVTFVADGGYAIESASGCGGSLSGNTYTTGPVTENCTVLAAFGTIVKSWSIPVTGQAGCWDEDGTAIACAGTGQDGETQAGTPWPISRFTDNGNETMTDNLTGIIWAKDANIMKTRDSFFYSNGVPGDGTVSMYHVQEYIQKLNTEKYLGYSDWRLPNLNELLSIIHHQSVPFAWLLNQGFINVQPGDYYSSTRGYVFPWYVNMEMGQSYDFAAVHQKFVWPIRGELLASNIPRTGKIKCSDWNGRYIPCGGTGQDGEFQAGISSPVPRFKDNGDQSVTDALTGLVWTKDAKVPGPAACGTGLVKSWQQGLDYVKCLNDNKFLGAGSWRMPNINEMGSLLNPVVSDLPTWLNDSGFSNVQTGHYWSSSSGVRGNSAWYLDTSYSSLSTDPKWYSNYVWPVRGGTVTPVPGVCGSAAGKGFPDAPAINLCATGGASTVTGSGPWSWTCSGVNGGATASCSATYQQVFAKTFTSTDVPKSISHNATVTSSTAVASGQCTSVFDVNLSLDITHTSVGDMEIRIDHNGKTVDIVSGRCRSWFDIDATFDNQASLSIECPIKGTFSPAGDLGSFVGDDAAGNWTLNVTDVASGNDGTLNGWSLQLTCPRQPSDFVVTPGAVTNGSISPATPQLVSGGAAKSFTITPNVGYRVVTPMGGTCPQGTLNGTSYTTGVIAADCTVAPAFTPANHSLSVTVAGTGSGTVTSNPVGISCITGTCTKTFSAGSSVDLYATPSSQSPFFWSGACSGEGDCSVLMDKDKAVTATFANLTARVSILGDPKGYLSIGAALDAVISAGRTVKARGELFPGHVIMVTPYPVRLQGGYLDDGFITRTGTSRTIIDGSLRIRRGTLRVDRVGIR
ncbi:MAG: hypothetical protein A2075_24200 [Geobacteraceae bacterium GWC2_58_44]|nr:MAG: hypothetical protein A2075_24200 [Geobacteraceae bacterium GWC2_58_44]HBG05118.1 hypothetical protein [Geobacter sp.]